MAEVSVAAGDRYAPAHGVSLREAIQLTSLSRGSILARIYSGEWPVTRFGRRLILPRAFLLDTLAKGATGGVPNGA